MEKEDSINPLFYSSWNKHTLASKIFFWLNFDLRLFAVILNTNKLTPNKTKRLGREQKCLMNM